MPFPRKFLARFTSFLGFVIGIAGVGFVVRTLVDKWDQVSDAYSQVDSPRLVLSLLLGLGAMTIIGSVWVTMLTARHHDVKHRNALSWYFTGQLGKYVPGGIWPIVGRAELATRNGVTRIDAYASTGLSLVSTYLAAVVTIAIGAILSAGHRLVGAAIFAALGVGYLLFSNERLRVRTVALASKVSPAAQSLTDPVRLAKLTAQHVPAWILMSLSTSVTASAFGADIGILEMLFVTSTSWLAGFVVVGVPGGIGVREAVFTSLATGAIGAPLAVSLALLSRVIFITVDIVGALISNLVSRRFESVKA